MGISVTDSEEEARRFVARNGFAFANGRDADLRIARAFEVDSTPTTILITPSGQILGRTSGAFPDQQLTNALQTLLDYGKKR